jgi:hypothetical protein
MTRKANLLGLEVGELHAVRERVESILGLSLDAHDSEYHGGDYFKTSAADYNVVVQTNFVEQDGEPTEAEFPNETLLVFVNGDEATVDRMSAVLLENGFKLLRTGTF